MIVQPASPSDAGRARSRQAPPAIVLEDIGKQYNRDAAAVAAVAGVSLEVWPGELTVLIGPSGSGKTTLLSIMGAILRPSAGRVIVGGHDVTNMPESARSRIRLAHIGFVFQSYNLFPTLSARRNVEIVLELKGCPRRERRSRALALLAEMGLADKADATPADLSGGQQQRVAVARALAGDSTIILADEPTAALDSANGRSIMKSFRALASEQRRAVVIVSHDSRVVDLADRVIRIEDGRISEDTEKTHSRRAVASGTRSRRGPTLVKAEYLP